MSTRPTPMAKISMPASRARRATSLTLSWGRPSVTMMATCKGKGVKCADKFWSGHRICSVKSHVRPCWCPEIWSERPRSRWRPRSGQTGLPGRSWSRWTGARFWLQLWPEQLWCGESLRTPGVPTQLSQLTASTQMVLEVAFFFFFYLVLDAAGVVDDSDTGGVRPNIQSLDDFC